MALTLDDLFRTPDHYLHSFDGDDAVFVPMDSAAYERSIFLDGRISPAGDGSMRLPLVALAGVRARCLRTVWIMHVAHCGSTLLARALDAVSDSLVLREPQALRQIAVQGWSDRLPNTAALLSKRYREDAPTLIKGNVPINFLLPQIAALDRGAAMVFLYLPLRDYLLAILRDEDHRAWLRRVTESLGTHLGPLANASDAQRAAALWLAQIEIYASAGRDLSAARSLDAELFFADPAAVLAAVATHLGIKVDEGAVRDVVAGPLFSTYSKNPNVAFDNSARVTRKHETDRRLTDDLAVAENWLRAHEARAEAALEALDSMRLELPTA
jgi:hypothetical protein